ncbi:unnamed protein product [Prorocentrum cordatum]|uniref:Integrase catalytic domain-containing protein n=1 Tax=Prorocentrum cordatum TaxID=2364126 RepID=A0ABN9T1G6_9DINO|nr:unnamed protein product [Polarella glacialis]
MSGLLMVVVHCPTRDPTQLLEIFNLAWLSWAGHPDHVACDRDGAFQAAFVEHLEAHDVHVEKPPAEAHWPSGRVEANITLWKHMAKKVIDTMQLAGVEDMKLMAPAINQSRNSRVRQCGASPYQWTFGKDPRIPDSITDPANSAVVHSAMTADAELAKRARALFCFHNKSHRIIMIIGIHVDDLIGGADAREGSKLLETIRQRFTFGKWWDNKLTYCGKHLSKNENGTIFINQKEFCSQCICDA